MKENISPAQKKTNEMMEPETRQGVVLSINSGLLSGSERFIDAQSFLIGSGPEADIILLDEGIAPVHLVVSITRSMLGVSISIHAMAEGISLADRKLYVDETAHSQNEFDISIAGVELRIQDAKGFKYHKKNNPENLSLESDIDVVHDEPHHANWPAFLAMAAVVCIGFSVFLFSYSFESISNDVRQSSDKDISDEVNRDRFILKLKQKMKETGLDTLLEARKKGSNGIQVSGQLRTGYDKKWILVLQWYDAQENSPLLFNQVAKASGKSNLPRVKFAWFGKDPYIVLEDNQKLAVGDSVKSGWKVDAVDVKGVVLSQADRQILLKFE